MSFAVEFDGEPFALRFEPSSATRCWQPWFHTINLFSSAFNDAIKTNIVFKGVCANYVVVVGIDDTNGNTACLVNASSNGLEARGNVDVLSND